MALFVDLVALSNGLHGSVQMDSVALFSWIGWLRHHGILNEIPDFALISTRLDEISTASDVLRLWIEKTIQVNKLNGTLFYEEVDKLKK